MRLRLALALLSCAASARALDWVPIGGISALGGLHTFDGRSGSFSGNLDAAFAPAMSLSDQWSLLPSARAVYEGTRQINDVLGTGTVAQQSAEARLGLRGVYGDPAAVAKYWHAQSLEDNCGLMSVADIVGETTGQEPTEEQILTLAEHTPSVVNPGTQIYAPRNDPSHTNGNGGVSMGDLVVLLDHYGIKSTMSDDDHPDQTGMPAVQGYLGAGRKVIAYVNSAVVWNTSDQRSTADHFLVVTGVDTNTDIVHLNDPGADHADEQVSTATFKKAWQTSGDSIVFTAPLS